MLLGQLYYFEKKLESVKFQVENENIEKVEIIGIEVNTLKSLKGLPPSEIYSKLLVAFTQKYSEILLEEEMVMALETWNLIVNPYKSTHESFKFPIFNKVNSWIDGNPGVTIDQLLVDIGISQEDEEFSIIYGLKVLKVLLGNDDIRSNSGYEGNNSKQINPDIESKIVVVCRLAVSPLVTNLNCFFVDSQLSDLQIIEEINSTLNKYPNISLILIEEDKFEYLRVVIKKRLENQLLIAPLDLQIEENSGYFDNLVKKTLGVRLV
jgi:hypothetical protein